MFSTFVVGYITAAVLTLGCLYKRFHFLNTNFAHPEYRLSNLYAIHVNPWSTRRYYLLTPSRDLNSNTYLQI